jgi:Flp pilus assembly protein CpaB
VTKGRRLVVVLGLILTTLATAWVLLFTRDVQFGPKHGGPIVFAVVSEVDVPAGADLNQLIKDDQLRIILVPEDAAVDGTVTSVDQLKDRRNTIAILAGEPILAARLKIVAERHRSALVSKAMTIGA